MAYSILSVAIIVLITQKKQKNKQYIVEHSGTTMGDLHPRSLQHIMTRIQNKINTMIQSSRNKNMGGKTKIRYHQNKKIYNSYVKSSFFDFKINFTSLDHRLKLAMAKCSGIGQVLHVFTASVLNSFLCSLNSLQ